VRNHSLLEPSDSSYFPRSHMLFHQKAGETIFGPSLVVSNKSKLVLPVQRVELVR